MRALFLFAVLVSVVAQPANAAQTCPAGYPRVAPDDRYTVQGNGTVTDLRTGLMWKQCSEGQTGATCTGTVTRMTWTDALNAGADSVFAGFSDWRLPNVKELSSLVETGCHSPAINEARFPNTWTEYYWTSSSSAENSSNALYVRFIYGYVLHLPKSYDYGVRLVRDGQ